MEGWIAKLFAEEAMRGMGHNQRVQDLNLGMGWIYYGLVRMMRPKLVVVIGSYRGFSPLVFGKALQDNGDSGQLIFIDPGLVDGFWKDPDRVREHFHRFGVDNIHHFPMTTQEFMKTELYGQLKNIGILFVDGFHTDEYARIDHKAFERRLAPDGITLFHDSVNIEWSTIYGEERGYLRDVSNYMDDLEKREEFEVLNFPICSGLTLVRKKQMDLRGKRPEPPADLPIKRPPDASNVASGPGQP